MNISKIITLCAVLCLFLAGVYWISFGGEIFSSDIEPENLSSDMHVQLVGQVENDVSRFDCGWNPVAFNNSLSYIRSHSDDADTTVLIDKLVSGTILKLDSVASIAFRSIERRQRISSHDVLGPVYQGFDYLCNQYNVVGDSPAADRLRNNREIYNFMYSYNSGGAGPDPVFNLRVVAGGNLDWNEHLADMDAYESRRKRILDEKRRLVASSPDLCDIIWIQSALSNDTFDENIRQAHMLYIEKERRALLNTLSELNTNGYYSDNEQARNNAASQLYALSANLPQPLQTPEIIGAINNVRRSFIQN